jgi:hypothetical protein
MRRGCKKAQVTIFIIIAIVIIGLGILVYSFYPQIRSTFISEVKNPQAFIQDCLEDEIGEVIDDLSLHGGQLNPESFYLYQGNKIRYLCYTDGYYETCIVQEPMLKESIEEEIKNAINVKASQCFDDLKKAYQGQGYQVTLSEGDMGVELLPKRVVATFDNIFTLRKDTTETYDKFDIVINNNIYELVSISLSIINYEAAIGNVDITSYMDYYPDLKAEKITQSDGTKIYILTDRNTNKKFQFASRSLAWPPGYSNE